MKFTLGIILIYSCFVFGQKSKELDSLKITRNINASKVLTLDELLTYWILNEKDDPKMPRIFEFYSDSTNTYFLRSGRPYKILNSEISKIDLNLINGDSIRTYFFSNVVPESDQSKSKNCSSAMINPKFKCKYIDSETIQICCHLKIVCDLIPVLNKKYIVNYNLKSKSYQII